MTDKKVSKVETEKENSRFLRGTIREQLAQDTAKFDETGPTILKFHGIYQQDDRDQRQKRQLEGQDKYYMMMVRTKTPGGRASADQYLKFNELADVYGNGTLRITTRQGIQFHGVLKKNLFSVMNELNKALVTTLGACGDIVRNVCSCPAPDHERKHSEVLEYAKKISDFTLPKTRAYHEIWINGEKACTSEETEPLYGKTYLPRKFKIAVAHPGDNCVDLYTNDLGFISILKGTELEGFNIVAGGGMGMTHRKTETYPVLAKPLGFVKKEKVLEVCDGIIKTQRDFGNRENRAHARLKYLIEDRGIEWFSREVAKRTGFVLEPFRPIAWAHTDDHLGWHDNGSGQLYFGLFVENGRIKDTQHFKLKSGLLKIVQAFRPELRFTTNQNVILNGIPSARKSEFEKILIDHGIHSEKNLPNILRWSMACPAIPTCGLAITESERALPGIVREIAAELSRLGLEKESITLRMTGCPNGCARPYSSEIGLVGNAVNQYVLFLAGNFEGTRLNQSVHEKVKIKDIVPLLKLYFEKFKAERNDGERFGDYCHRLGLEALRSIASAQLHA